MVLIYDPELVSTAWAAVHALAYSTGWRNTNPDYILNANLNVTTIVRFFAPPCISSAYESRQRQSLKRI